MILFKIIGNFYIPLILWMIMGVCFGITFGKALANYYFDKWEKEDK